MSVLVYIDAQDKITKNALEAVYYGKLIDNDVTVVTYGNTSDSDLEALGKYGANKVLVNKSLSNASASQITKLVANAVEKTGASVIVFSQDFTGKAVAPRLSAKLKAGLISGAISEPNTDNGFTVKVNVFSGKAFGSVKVNTDKKIIALLPNSFQPIAGDGSASVESFDADCGESKIQIKEVKTVEGEIPLPEAELVVSAGRGLKGPENWGIVEDLAKALGAATACSRPVADSDWRPHHEHVGQTGVAIRPNLYIAAGISGAIQHLAGVNGSKVIVVINTDSEAPFFKAADYGIIGDAFEVLPRLTEAVKNFKANN